MSLNITCRVIPKTVFLKCINLIRNDFYLVDELSIRKPDLHPKLQVREKKNKQIRETMSELLIFENFVLMIFFIAFLPVAKNKLFL